jgi:hypothetical protein
MSSPLAISMTIGTFGLLADLPREISAVSIRKHHVEQHEIGRASRWKGLSSAGKRGCDLGLELVTPESLREWFRDGRLVLPPGGFESACDRWYSPDRAF